MSDYEIRSAPRQDTAVVAVSTAPDGIGDAMSEAFPQVYGALVGAGGAPAGPPFSRYFSFGGDQIECEVGIPVATPFDGTGDVKAGEIGGCDVAVALHVGPYDTIGETWGALNEWITSQGRTVAGPGWETYLTDPSEVPDPADWRTEILIPVE